MARPEPCSRTLRASTPFPNLYSMNPRSRIVSPELRNEHSSRKLRASLYLSNFINAIIFSLAARESVGDVLRTSLAISRTRPKLLEDAAIFN